MKARETKGILSHDTDVFRFGKKQIAMKHKEESGRLQEEEFYSAEVEDNVYLCNRSSYR